MRDGGLSGELWPAHLKPKEDEILSSWLFRLALAHGLNPAEFSSIVWPRKPDFFTHLDEKEDAEIFEVLARKTGTPLERVRGTSLASYEPWLFSADERHSNNVPWLLRRAPWIMPTSNTAETILFGQQFCPHCLKEKPYFRRRWHLALWVICESHQVQLQDRCPSCGEPVNLQSRKLLLGRKLSEESITLCHPCGFDLRRAIPRPSRPAVNDDEVEFQKFLLKALRQGWVEIPGSGAVYSHLYFTVLHKFMRKLSVESGSDSLREAISKHYQIPNFLISFPSRDKVERRTLRSHTGTYRYLEMLNVDERRGLLRMSARLLSNWPANFISFCGSGSMA